MQPVEACSALPPESLSDPSLPQCIPMIRRSLLTACREAQESMDSMDRHRQLTQLTRTLWNEITTRSSRCSVRVLDPVPGGYADQLNAVCGRCKEVILHACNRYATARHEARDSLGCQPCHVMSYAQGGVSEAGLTAPPRHADMRRAFRRFQAFNTSVSRRPMLADGRWSTIILAYGQRRRPRCADPATPRKTCSCI